MINKIGFLMLILCPGVVLACRPVNGFWNPGNYEVIVRGVVEQVEILPYQMVMSDDGVLEAIVPVDVARKHRVTVRVSSVIRGNAEAELILEPSGCGIVIPENGEEGIFMISQSRNWTVSVYETQEELHRTVSQAL